MKKKSNKVVAFLVITANIIIVLGIVLGINYKPSAEEIKKKIKKQVDEDAGEFFEKNEESLPNVILPGWTSISIAANTKEITSGINFYNPEKNEGYYYLTFELKIGEESLYKSDLVPPGKHIQKITLSRALEKGEYDASVVMQPYKWDQSTPTNNGVVNIKLIVG